MEKKINNKDNILFKKKDKKWQKNIRLYAHNRFKLYLCFNDLIMIPGKILYRYSWNFTQIFDAISKNLNEEFCFWLDLIVSKKKITVKDHAKNPILKILRQTFGLCSLLKYTDSKYEYSHTIRVKMLSFCYLNSGFGHIKDVHMPHNNDNLYHVYPVFGIITMFLPYCLAYKILYHILASFYFLARDKLLFLQHMILKKVLLSTNIFFPRVAENVATLKENS